MALMEAKTDCGLVRGARGNNTGHLLEGCTWYVLCALFL